MLNRLLGWLDSRTGYRRIVNEALYERIPSGARWRYITGSMLVFAFVTQSVTGIFLWMAYSPSSQTAYESVYFIQHEMAGGWLVRGIHHFMAQAMVVVMALHLLQVVWDGAYRAPREVNHWLGLVLLQLVLGLGLTGYLLPWDQKGYWATNVATNLATLVPGVGKQVQQLAVGGNEYGHHTLTRFFAMHAGVLPVLLIAALTVHIALFRRHGIMATITPGRADETFWPKQVLLDAAGCLVLLAIVLLCVFHWDLNALASGKFDPAHLGAELGAPADPAEAYSAARPEWYYLFLFQLLKYFPGSSEIIGAIVIPGVVMTIFALMPFIGWSNLGHRFNQAFTVLVLLAAVGLTGAALFDDYYAQVAPRLGLHDNKKLTASKEFLAARADAEIQARRSIELINRREMLPDGKLSDVRLIPKQGAVYLLRNDPLTRGPRLFGQHCAGCHDYADPKGQRPPQVAGLFQSPVVGEGGKVVRSADEQVTYGDAANSAPNLYGFASREWIKGLLNHDLLVRFEIGPPQPSPDPKIAADKDRPDNHKRPIDAPYFGNTGHKTGRMAAWVKEHSAKLLKDDPAKSDDDLDAIVTALSAQAKLPGQAAADGKDKTLIERGVGLIELNCTKGCHKFGASGQLGLAPDLTGYGSYEWMLGLASDPAHERFYRQENDGMPSFAANLAQPEKNQLSVRELSLIVDWLRGDYYRAGDAAPRLPHPEDVAQKAVQLARTTASPWTSVVGAPQAAKPSEAQQAERLFAANCAACHSHTYEHGRGIAAAWPSAPNLFGFGSRAWLAGMLDLELIQSDRYFGQTRHAKGDMVGFVESDLAEPNDAAKAKVAAIVAALSAEAALPSQADEDKKAADDGMLERGRKAMGEAFENQACVECHKFRDAGDVGSAPVLTGWASKDWLVRFISDPTHDDFYRATNDRMPSFGKDPRGPKQPLLSPEQIELLARWLRGELSGN
ncbi:MAG TPA: cytochrome b N-terminal domain-containing protein [Pirellulaceae bacterium]|nr:cytochrome b N-terminal domain-containing protein [Pirellulaceae bacterium]